MKICSNLKGIIFDYGGTIDTNSCHWAEVIWQYYRKNNISVDYESFREAYVFGERSLAKYPFIRPEHNFMDVLNIKIRLQIEYLASKGMLSNIESDVRYMVRLVADGCYNHVLETLKITRPVIETLSHKYPLVLVSNFYGNIETILKDFKLDTYFKAVIESSVVGVRKPNPEIFMLGVKALGIAPNETLVVGDSYTKDMVPAKSLGCKVVWLEGKGWGKEEIDKSLPDCIITSLNQLLDLF